MDDDGTIDLAFRPRGYWSTDIGIDYPMRAEAPGYGEGSYLPALEMDEVEIAGVALASVTGDVISIRAKRVSEGIRYRVVDEYETTFEIDRPVRPDPLSLGELIESYLDLNWEGRELQGDPGELRDFVEVISPFYPQLTRVVEERVDAWIDRTRSGEGWQPGDTYGSAS